MPTTNLGIDYVDGSTRFPEVPINAAFDVIDAAIGTGLAAYASYTPTWTNLTVGNGTVVAKYVQVGKSVTVRISLIFGSTTSVSGDIQVSLPVTAVAPAGTAGVVPWGIGKAYDSGTAVYGMTVIFISTTKAGIRPLEVSGTYQKDSQASGTVPFSWGTGDELDAQFTYEAA